jgi:general stress protein 26
MIPSTHKDLLEKPIVVVLSSITPKNTPHVAPVWRRFDGEFIYITSDLAAQKVKNAQHNPHVSVIAIDPTNSGRWIDIRGEVIAITAESALEELDRHTKLYTGKDHYYGNIEPIESKEEYDGVILKIKPIRVVTSG